MHYELLYNRMGTPEVPLERYTAPRRGELMDLAEKLMLENGGRGRGPMPTWESHVRQEGEGAIGLVLKTKRRRYEHIFSIWPRKGYA